MQSFAIGGLGWSPESFWNATCSDLMAAVEWHERETERREEQARMR
jgi:hypothetical protein